MKRTSTRRCGSIVGHLRTAARVGFLAMLALFGAPSVWASPPATAKANLAAAVADFDALVRKSRQAGDMPRWSDPEAARVLGRLWDVPSILGAPPYVAADVPVVLEINAQLGVIYKSYLLFTANPGSQPDTDANTFRFQDEIARTGAFMMRVMAAQSQSAEAFWTSLPTEQRTSVRRAGVMKFRTGLLEFLVGNIIMMRDPNLSSGNRAVLMDGLVATTDVIAQALSRPDRAALRAQFAAATTSLSREDRNRLVPVVAALVRTDCAALCSVE